MTSKEMLEIFSGSSHRNPNVSIVGFPREVPHGGIALDIRVYAGEIYFISCVQLYGTTDALASTQLILEDKNIPPEADSEAVDEFVSSREDHSGKELAGIFSMKVFPSEKCCKTHMRKLEKELNANGYTGGFVFMDLTGSIRYFSSMNPLVRLYNFLRSNLI